MPDVTESLLAAIRWAHEEPPGDLPLHEPLIGDEEMLAVAACLRSGFVSSHGPLTGDFERHLAAVTGSKHVVATVNGTAALHLALMACGVEPGDEVLVPAFTFVATANAVTYCGARPHFIDSEPDSMGMCPDSLATYLRSTLRMSSGVPINRWTGARIRAVVVMHAYGHPALSNELVRTAEHWGLAVIEDAAEALGSSREEVHVGLTGDAGVLSFNGNKIITAGGGGAILSRREDITARARHLGSTAKRYDPLRLDHDDVGWNYRLPNLNAALASAQLGRLPALLNRKRELAARYLDALADDPALSVVAEPSGTQSNYWLVVAQLRQGGAGERDDLVRAAGAAGYSCRAGWKLLTDMPMYRGCARAPLPVATHLSSTTIALPSSPWSTASV